MKKLRRHHQVVEEKLGWMELVGTNAANTCGEMNDDVGTTICEKPPDRRHVAQVVVGASWHKDLIALELSQPFDDERAQEARPAGDHHSLVLPETHT